MLHPLNHQLSDSITSVNLILLARVGVDQQHLDFASVAGINKARSVQAGHPVLQGQAASGLDEAGEPFGKCHLDPSGHKATTTTSGQNAVLTGHKVTAPVIGMGIGGDP